MRRERSAVFEVWRKWHLSWQNHSFLWFYYISLGHVTKMEDIHACWKPSSSARSRKKNVIKVLTESIAKISQRDSLSRWESTTRHGSRRLQTITAGTPQREKQVRRLRQRGNLAAKERCRRQKEQAASQPSSSEAFTCPKCSMISASRIGLYSHQQVCKSQWLWRNTLITTYFSSNLQPDCNGKKKKKKSLRLFYMDSIFTLCHYFNYY